MNDETLVERVRRVAWGNHGPKLTETEARAILREVADAVEEEGREGTWLKKVRSGFFCAADLLREQAAEEGA